MPAETSADDPTEAIIAAWRAESARLVGALTRMTRDVELAEDLAQDALLAALEQWPTAGVPENPGAWLMTTAKRRGVDHFRRADSLRRKIAELEHVGGEGEEEMPHLDAQVDHIEDDVLRLIFLSCHPSLTAESRAALTLRLVGGLTTAEIARGFLTNEATMGQRISRAKKTLSEARAEFELPDVLSDAAPGPVVEVNRAVAHGRAFGPDAGLAVLEELDASGLGDSPLVPSVRGDLLERAGLHARASEAFNEAAARTKNAGERAVLHRRAELNRTRASEPE